MFLAPAPIAYVFYKHPYWLSAPCINKGELLVPSLQLLIERVGDVAQDSQVTQLSRSADLKWKLLLWVPDVCGKDCMLQLDRLARVRLALGRRLYDTKVLLLVDSYSFKLPQGLLNVLKQQDIGLARVAIGARALLPILQNGSRVFIANPNDYLILGYLPSVASNDIYNDLKQLLTMRN